MTQNPAQQSLRTLAQIESDLLEAETAFVDADDRLKEAERDRRAALDAINNHQIELDYTVAEMRRRGAPGSNWQVQGGNATDTLVLQAADIFESQPARPRLASVAVEFDHLKAAAQFAQHSPGEAKLNGRTLGPAAPI